jgi:hypothetical protein
MGIFEQPFRLQGGTKKKDHGGVISYRNRFGELHRTDGPALIRRRAFRLEMMKEGLFLAQQEYCQRGARHRKDAPAVIYDMREAVLFQLPFWEYYEEGKLHREDGPARIFPGRLEWYKDDELHRADGPAVIRFFSDSLEPIYEYHREGELHRSDGPAVVYPRHEEKDVPLMEYWYDGQLERDDGPVIIWNNGESWARRPSWKAEISS